MFGSVSKTNGPVTTAFMQSKAGADSTNDDDDNGDTTDYSIGKARGGTLGGGPTGGQTTATTMTTTARSMYQTNDVPQFWRCGEGPGAVGMVARRTTPYAKFTTNS